MRSAAYVTAFLTEEADVYLKQCVAGCQPLARATLLRGHPEAHAFSYVVGKMKKQKNGGMGRTIDFYACVKNPCEEHDATPEPD